MTQPVTLATATPRFALPYLFAAQAQKEPTINEALAAIDGALHPVVHGVASAPPADPEPGTAWLVGAAASGAFAGREDQIATYQTDRYFFISPAQGLRVYDSTAGAFRTYRGGWSEPAAIAAPDGGATIDIEARDAIAQLTAVLVAAGLVPPS